jgi:hypothetical protein
LVTDSSSLGLQRSRPVYYVWALVLFVVLGVLSLVTIYVFFPGYYDRPGGAASQYAGVQLGVLTLSYSFVREYLRGFGRGTVLSRAGRVLVDQALGVLGRQRRAEPGVLGASPSGVERGSGSVAAAAGTVGFRLALRLAVVPLGEYFAGMVGTQFRHRVRRSGRDEVRHSKRRVSENAVKAKFAEFSFCQLRCNARCDRPHKYPLVVNNCP